MPNFYQTKKNNLTFAVLILGLMVNVSSCKDESDQSTNEGIPTQSLNDFIMGLEDPIQETPTGEEQIGEVLTEIDEETSTFCECKKYKMSAQFDETLILDPTTDVIFLGNILEGNSVTNGSYRPIALERAPLTISTDFMNLDGLITRTIEKPSLSSVTAAIKDMMYDTEINGATAAVTTFEIENIKSENDLAIRVGASVSYKKMKLNENFDFSKTSTTSKFLVKYTQTYFTVNLDIPSSPAKFFDMSVTADDLKRAIGGGNTVPVYVSSIKYGRAAYFCVESSEDSTSIKNTLDATFTFAKDSAKLETNISKSESLKKYKITGSVIGGSAEDAATTIKGSEEMINFIIKGGNFSKQSPAKPIAFTLRRLSNHEIFNVVNGTEFVARSCRSTNASIIPHSFYGIKGENDVCGEISVQIQYGDDAPSSKFYIFNRAIVKDQAVHVPAGGTVTYDGKPAEGKQDVNSPDQIVPFKIDYTRFDEAKLIVRANLHEWDDPCACGGNHREYDDYEPYYNEFLLSDIQADNGQVILDEIQLSKEYTENHHTSGLFNTVSHDPKNVSTDCRIRFIFNVRFE